MEHVKLYVSPSTFKRTDCVFPSSYSSWEYYCYSRDFGHRRLQAVHPLFGTTSLSRLQCLHLYAAFFSARMQNYVFRDEHSRRLQYSANNTFMLMGNAHWSAKTLVECSLHWHLHYKGDKRISFSEVDQMKVFLNHILSTREHQIPRIAVYTEIAGTHVSHYARTVSVYYSNTSKAEEMLYSTRCLENHKMGSDYFSAKKRNCMVGMSSRRSQIQAVLTYDSNDPRPRRLEWCLA